MKNLLYAAIMIFGNLLLITSCNPSNVPMQENITIGETNNNYFQIDGGIKYYNTKTTVTGTNASNNTQLNKYTFTFTNKDDAGNESTVKFVVTFPYGQLISGTYNLISDTRKVDPAASSFTQIIDGTTLGPYTNLTKGVIVVKKENDGNYTFTYNLKGSAGGEITGKYSGAVTSN